MIQYSNYYSQSINVCAVYTVWVIILYTASNLACKQALHMVRPRFAFE